MKPLCCSKTIDLFGNGGFSPKQRRRSHPIPNFLSYLLIIMLFLVTTLTADERYAFIYSKNIDDKFINFYDKVIVEADAIDNIYAIRHPKKMVAYVSVGEIEPWRKTKTKYDPSWVISKNKTWNSLIADLRKNAYQEFIFERIEKLHKQGYRNFFLDTMDAYHVTVKDKKLFKTQQKALISFIQKLHKKHPDSKIIVNRGFEILKEIHNNIDAVVAESLLNRYNHNKKEYIDVPKADREWLLARFKEAKKYGLDVISIDYTDKSTKERRDIAKKIKRLGVIPYVTDGLLQEQGECEIERVRRDVLILFNSSIFKDNNSVYSNVHLLASMPLEYWGYIPILHDISIKNLPHRVEDRYHSVIVWSEGKTKNNEKIYEWAKNIKDKKIKILFLNRFVFTPTPERLKEFGISHKKNNNSFINNVTIKYTKPYKKYEIPASIDFENEVLIAKESKAVIMTHYKNGQKSMPIAITPWGGYALNSSFLHHIKDKKFWTINPFIFFKDALKLDSIPVPDPTTESGRRILFIHIDGDGFREKVHIAPDKLAAEYLMEHIYKKYQIPQTVSLVQSEIDIIGLYPKLTSYMKKIAREIYKIPWIEPASHIPSLPFSSCQADGNLQDSVDFVLSLAPKSKQKERLIFWSSYDCLPRKVVLAYCERDRILGMNGGNTTIRKSDPWLSHIAPFGLQREEYWQIYTAQQNENVYTNNWLGPFWGYRDVIETFQLTEKPYRIKPINIYYHFYSGSKLASFKALNEVYSWAVAQKTSKLYASQYIKKARGFYQTSIGKTVDGFEIKNSGFLRTVRFDKKIHINMKRSRGVAGYKHHKDTTYVTLDSRENHLVVLSKKQQNSPYLIDANGWAIKASYQNNIYNFQLKANLPLEAKFYMPTHCRLMPIVGFKIKILNKKVNILTKEKRGAALVFECQQ